MMAKIIIINNKTIGKKSRNGLVRLGKIAGSAAAIFLSGYVIHGAPNLYRFSSAKEEAYALLDNNEYESAKNELMPFQGKNILIPGTFKRNLNKLEEDIRTSKISRVTRLIRDYRYNEAIKIFNSIEVDDDSLNVKEKVDKIHPDRILEAANSTENLEQKINLYLHAEREYEGMGIENKDLTNMIFSSYLDLITEYTSNVMDGRISHGIYSLSTFIEANKSEINMNNVDEKKIDNLASGLSYYLGERLDNWIIYGDQADFYLQPIEKLFSFLPKNSNERYKGVLGQAVLNILDDINDEDINLASHPGNRFESLSNFSIKNGLSNVCDDIADNILKIESKVDPKDWLYKIELLNMVTRLIPHMDRDIQDEFMIKAGEGYHVLGDGVYPKNIQCLYSAYGLYSRAGMNREDPRFVSLESSLDN